MQKSAGQQVGAIRDAASAAGPAMTGEDMANAIREQLKAAYSKGGENYDQIDALERELQNIKAMPSTTPSDFAERATAIKQKAKGKAFALPTNVDTDAANAMSHINDAEIANRLPDQVGEYTDAKQKLGDAKDLGNIIQRGERRNMNSRGGNTMWESGTRFVDELGAHKVGARVGMAVGDTLQGVEPLASKAAMGTTNGVVSAIMSKIQTNPTALGKYAAPLMQAAQGGPQGIAATHYVLSLQHPEYNKMWQGDDSASDAQ